MDAPGAQAETHAFQAEVAELLNRMVHSVYSETDIFLRELISNASDACDKLRYEAIARPELLAGADRLAEIARQLRLRDLAGLIVIDFIDMDEKRNNRAVERRLKESLKHDRARIQVGRISHFGLLEMSRQRIRTGVIEGSTVVCPHCQGAGVVRSTASIALHVLRVLEDALIKSSTHDLTVRTRMPVALYILNQKRLNLRDLEHRFGVAIVVEADDVRKAFGQTLLIDEMEFKLPPGGIIGVIGPNGAGKTTLFRMILGQEPPDAGTIRVGETVRLGYIDQNRTLDPDKTIFEEITGGTELVLLGPREMNSRAYVARFNFSGSDQQKKVG